jgi:hypothetical protein
LNPKVEVLKARSYFVCFGPLCSFSSLFNTTIFSI